MKTVSICLFVACAALHLGCATARSYEVEMRRRQGVIFIGLVYYAPVRSDGENASAETLVVEARKVIQKELVRRGLGNMTINVEKPVRYEGSSDYVQLLAYAGEMPLDELVRAARAIIDADPLGKQRPAPFYRGRGNID